MTIIKHPLFSVKNSGLSGLAWCTILIKYVPIQKQSEIKKLFVRSTVLMSRMISMNCYNSWSCSPVIIGFVQCQHSSVQLVQKKLDRNTKLKFQIFSSID